MSSISSVEAEALESETEKVWQPRSSGISCRKEGMRVINTFHVGEATLSSTRGTLSRIDFFAVLAEMLA